MADEAAGGSGGTSKIVLIATILNIVITLGMGGVLFISFQKEKSKTGVEDIVAGQAKEGHGDKGGHGDAKEGGHGEAKGGGGGHGEGGHGGSGEVAVDSGKIMNLDAFTVNLSSGVGTAPRYVRMNISVELEKGVSEKEFEAKLPKVRDTFINLLNAKKAQDINAAEGREQLKDEMKRSINSFLSVSKVKGVYFTNFAVSN